MSEEEIINEGTISRAYKKMELFKTWVQLSFKDGMLIFVILLVFFISSYIAETALTASEVAKAINTRSNLMMITPFILFIGVVIIDIITLLLNYIYLTAYLNNFHYVVVKDAIIIDYGVLQKNHITIPFSRIQNISTAQGVFDRLFKTHTLKLETAGGGGKVKKMYTQGGPITIGVKPEGYIPGLANPGILGDVIKKMMKLYSNIPSGVEDKILKPEDVAFDNFISLLLSNLEESNLFKVTLREMRELRGITPADLARKIRVSIELIINLERGEFSPSLVLAKKLAEELKCKINDLFQIKK